MNKYEDSIEYLKKGLELCPYNEMADQAKEIIKICSKRRDIITKRANISNY